MRTPPRRLVVAVLWVVAGAAAGWSGRAAWSQAPRMTTDVLFTRTTDEIPRRVALRVHLNRWDPGAETGRHEHAGPVLHYVLEGEVESVRDDGTEVFRVGQVTWEGARTPHNVRNASRYPARLLTIHLDPAR
ncbi:MAG: cupin domain-containing protein [Candidatus Rokubacteria bacterium]|nr:cupin domain-containing protein [Candidatus Rokubacteria bacterium]